MVSHETSNTSLDREAASTGAAVAEPPSRKPERQDEDDCDDATATTAMSWSCISPSCAGFEANLDDVSTSFSLLVSEVNKVEVEQGLNSSTGSSECVPGWNESGDADVEGQFQHSASASPTVARKSPLENKGSVSSSSQMHENSQLHRCKREMLEKVSTCYASTSAEHILPMRQDSRALSVCISGFTIVEPNAAKQGSARSTSEKLVQFEDGVRNDESMDTHRTIDQLDHEDTPSVPGPLLDLETMAAQATRNFDLPGAYVVRTMHAPSSAQLLTPVTVADPPTYLVEASLVVDDASSRSADGFGSEGGMDVFEAKPIKEISFWKNRRIQCAMLWIVFLTSGAAVGMTIGLMMKQHGNQSPSRNQDADVHETNTTHTSSVPTAPPSQVPLSIDWISQLQSRFPLSTVVALKSGDSPQSKAFQWVCQHPPTNNSLERMTQRFALATLFYATGGDHWDGNVGWLNATSHECDWFMSASYDMDLSCGLGDDSIVSLRLVRNSLDGTIPSEVALLTSLSTLQLELNPVLGGVIPAALNSISLEEVQLNENGLTGTLPDFNPNITAFLAWENNLVGGLPSSYANWTRLDRFSVRSNTMSGRFSEDVFGSWNMATSIDISDNKFNGTVSTHIGLLTSLMTLSLKANNFTGQVPSELGKLTVLHELYLGENRFTSTIPSELGSARRLQYLDLESNLHTGTIPTELAFLTDLEELRLGGNAFVGPLPGALLSLEKVRVLSFAENILNGTVPAEFAPQSKVQIISLQHNQFTGTLPKFSNGTSLIELRLNENKLTGTLPAELGLLHSLEVLDLMGNLLSGTIPSALGSLENIKELILSGNSFIGTVPVELCSLMESNNAKVEIDCDLVACDCGCACCGPGHNHS
jgi:Leucine-rich repeat (LRR) protein